jgi:hypothetical protein
MVGRSIAAAMAGRSAFLRLLAASLLAAFVVSLTAWIEARACPPDAKSHHATAQHKLRSADVIGKQVLTVSEATLATSVSLAKGGCGGVSSTADPCCKSGCCSAGVAIADLGGDAPLNLHLPATYKARTQDQLSPLPPPTHFRPPQNAA